MDETFHITRDGAVAVIELDRPEKKNALPVEDIAALGAALAEPPVLDARCLVVRGAGGVFSAGADLADVGRIGDPMIVLGEKIGPAIAALHALPIPTIASVEGPALGFGLGLALACDVVLAAEDAMLGNPFRRLGVVLDSGGHYFLRERLGEHLAAELIYTGRMLSGTEAAAMGLINAALPAGELAAKTMDLARDVADGPTQAFRLSKEILRHGTDLADILGREARAQVEAGKTADAAEGRAAFMEKRAPKFSGD